MPLNGPALPVPKPSPRPRSQKRTGRLRETPAGWVKLHSVKQGPCRLCGNPPQNNLHHLVPRSLLGDDVAANLIPLCGSGTTGCHGLIEARDAGALVNLAVRLLDDEYAYAIGKLGENALERLGLTTGDSGALR